VSYKISVHICRSNSVKAKWRLFGLSTARFFHPPTFLSPGARTTVRTDRQQVVINEQLGELLKSA
jgi:hypothetical protein